MFAKHIFRIEEPPEEEGEDPFLGDYVEAIFDFNGSDDDAFVAIDKSFPLNKGEVISRHGKDFFIDDEESGIKLVWQRSEALRNYPEVSHMENKW